MEETSFDWQKFGKFVWVCVIVLPLLIMSFMAGSVTKAKSIEAALQNTNISVCRDTDGNVWLKEVKNVHVKEIENPLGELTLNLTPK